MWWVRFEICARGVDRFGADKVFRGLALVDLSPRQYLGYWPPVLYLEEIVGFLYRLPGPGEQVLLREPAEREEVGRG